MIQPSPSSTQIHSKSRLYINLASAIIARLPNLTATLFILPAAASAIGLSSYGQMLAALAAGTVISAPFSGMNSSVRRELGIAIAAGDTHRQSMVFKLSITSGLLLLLCALPSALIAGYAQGKGFGFAVVSAIPVLVAFLNIFDNIQAAFGDHFITASLQACFQIAILLVIVVFGMPTTIIFAAALISAPSAIASVTTFIILTMRRRFSEQRIDFKMIFSFLRGSGVGWIADGSPLLSANIFLSAVGLFGDSLTAAWLGTFFRVFNILLTPVMLVVLPISSYIGVRWWNWDMVNRKRTIRLFAFGGIGYGTFVGALLLLAGTYYFKFAFGSGLYVPQPAYALACLLPAGIVIHKTYSTGVLSIAVPRLFTAAVAAVCIAALGMALLLLRLQTAETAAVAFSLMMGLLLPITIIIDSYYRICRIE